MRLAIRIAAPLIAAAFSLWASAAAAWEFAAAPVCTIWHDTGAAEMRVTYDPSQPRPYSITVTRSSAAWPEAALYAIRFEGGQGFTITTDRHSLGAQGRAVIAADSGFGNVLRGLARNRSAVALLGDQSETVPLGGAAEAVKKFEACARPGMV